MQFTCDTCPMKSMCKTPCAAVQAMLPAEDRGKLHRLRRRRALPKALDLLERQEDTRFLLAHRHRLKGRLREVFDLVYNDNLSHAEIAKILGLHRRSVGHLLASARRTIVRLARSPAGNGRG